MLVFFVSATRRRSSKLFSSRFQEEQIILEITIYLKFGPIQICDRSSKHFESYRWYYFSESRRRCDELLDFLIMEFSWLKGL